MFKFLLQVECVGQGQSSNPRTLDQVKQLKNEAQRQFDSLDKELQRKHKELRAQQDLVQQLREALTELKNEKLKLSSDIQKKERLDEQLHKLTSSIQTLKDEIEHDKQTLEPLIVRLFDSIKQPFDVLAFRTRSKSKPKKEVEY